MDKAEAHRILNAAREGRPVSQADIVLALWETGDRKPIMRSTPVDVSHAIPSFSGQTRIYNKPARAKNQRYVMTLPKIVHKPWNPNGT